MIRFALIFLAVLLALLAPIWSLWGQTFVLPFTEGVSWLAAQAIQLVDTGAEVAGRVIRDPQSGFSVSVEAGCNGLEAMAVLAAALIAFPGVPWGYRAKGILWGFLALQGLNILRVVSLFWLGIWNREVFQWVHLYLWPSLIMLDALVIWLYWLYRMPGIRRSNPAPAA